MILIYIKWGEVGGHNNSCWHICPSILMTNAVTWFKIWTLHFKSEHNNIDDDDDDLGSPCFKHYYIITKSSWVFALLFYCLQKTTLKKAKIYLPTSFTRTIATIMLNVKNTNGKNRAKKYLYLNTIWLIHDSWYVTTLWQI